MTVPGSWSNTIAREEERTAGMGLHFSVMDALTLHAVAFRGPKLMASAVTPNNPSPKDQLLKAFSSSLPLPSGTEPQLLGALCQVLQLPGSLVRGQLVYQMACAYKIEDDHAQELAIAIEYFHSASLLFDDLPCMDNAEERRGALCVHQVYGEAATILAALGLINRAYALLWRALADSPPERQSRALAYVERCLGVEGLLNGQSQDLHYAGLSQDGLSSEKVALSKTVSLIRLSLVLPALAGGVQAAELRMLERLAIFWGLSYQILDDLKDVYQKPDQTGKTSDRDATLNRPNVALAIGAANALLRIERLLRLGDRVLSRLTRRVPSLSFMEELRLRFREEIAAIEVTGPARNL
jgi:geranylgeranyl diphosphate synthase type II